MMGKQTVSLRLDEEIADALHNAAEDQGVTMTSLIRKALLDYLGTCPTCGQEIPKTADTPS